MTVSEMIAKLTAFQKRYGDMPMVVEIQEGLQEDLPGDFVVRYLPSEDASDCDEARTRRSASHDMRVAYVDMSM